MRKQLLSLFMILLFYVNGASAAFTPGYQYVHPKPAAKYVSPQTTIIVRFEHVSPVTLSNLSTFVHVEDSDGIVAGSTQLASDNNTVIFYPDRPFKLGSTVNVMMHPQFEQNTPFPVDHRKYQFRIAETAAITSNYNTPDERDKVFDPPNVTLQKKTVDGGARIMPNGVSVPSDFPHINVMTNIAPGDGYIFLNNRGRGTPYNIIFDNDGSPVWYLRTDDRRRDFKVQRNGTISMLARSGGHRFLNFDKNFKFLSEYSAVNGYHTDEHECIILENDHVLLIGRRETKVDMSRYVQGGKKNATVRETVIQEFTRNHEKIFEWRAWDHFEDILKYLELENLQGNYIRFPHMNAIDVDDDGHILLSSRHLSEVSKINRQTGEFIWRLGGPKNQFTFLNDDLNGFKNQHAVLSLGNNRYTVFDNGTARHPQVSRGVEYVLDPDKMTATLVWEYRNPPGTGYSHYMGNHQRLPNGNSLINWAVFGRPKTTEVTAHGQVVYEMDWTTPDECYRAFRFPWDGVVAKPHLIVEPAGDAVFLLFNKFGDHNVAYYNIYGGTSPSPTTLLDTSKTTLKAVRDLPNQRNYSFRVTAVSKDGKESAFSNEERIYVNLKRPGENMVINGDFSISKRNWKLENYNNAKSTWTAVTREGHIQISNKGTNRRSIAFYQGQMNLVKDQEYLLEFEAYAEQDRVIEVMVCQAGNTDKKYNKIGLTAIKNYKKKYSYVFAMQENTDYNADLRFHVGSDDTDVFLDNIVFRENTNVSVQNEPVVRHPEKFELFGNYPNPYNSKTKIHYKLPEKSDVVLKVYNILGSLVHEQALVDQSAGHYQLAFDSSELSSGIYIYQLDVRLHDGKTQYQAVNKMTVIR